MTKRRVDLVSKRILHAMAQQPGADTAALAAVLNVAEDVVSARIAQMHEDGILQGSVVRIDAAKVGMPHEVLVRAAPSGETTKAALETLCSHPGVTRVFTLADRRSIAFTVCGDALEGTQERARALAEEAALLDVELTLIINTLHDDAARAIGRALQPTP